MKNTAQNKIQEKTLLISNLFKYAVEDSSKALSKLLNTQVDISASKSYFAPLWDISNYFEPSEEVYTAVAMKITDDAKGVLLFLANESDALKISSCLTTGHEPPGKEQLVELKESALKEVANIIFGAFLTKVSQVSNVRLMTSIPDLTTDMIKASLDELCGELALYSTHALAYITDLKIQPLGFQGKLVLILDSDSIENIVKKVK